MNYRHAYHAGNHADVFKHIVLARAITHLTKKDKPFRIIDAHAGTALYDLRGIEAGKTGEWEGGVGKMAEPFADDVEALLAPWREVVAAVNPVGGVMHYPGSPEIALWLMRGGDRLIANELHPEDAAALERHAAFDDRITVTAVDAATCIKASLPPPERRGLVLIDPPYEEKDETERALRMISQGVRRFASGVFILWYPLKSGDIAQKVAEGVTSLGAPASLRVELRVREAFSGGGLAGSGLVILNTPWRLDAELSIVVPALAGRLGLGNWGHGQVDWLVPPV